MNRLLPANQKIHPIGMGTWHMGDDPNRRNQEIQALRAGLEQGANLIDTAEMYGEGRSETLVGEAIKPFERSSICLVSKFYPWNADQPSMRQSLENSLRRLKTDYLNLYLLHWPGQVPLEETVMGLETLKEEGKILNWGVSNFDTEEMTELFSLERGTNCITNQVLYNLGSRGIEFDLQPWMRDNRVSLMAYSPVAQGDRLGAGLTRNPVLKEIASAHQCSIYQLLLAWSLRDGNTVAIPQSGNRRHVIDNLEASDIHLSDSELAAIDKEYPLPTRKQPLEVL